MKLEVDHAKPSDCGAYKLVISNPNGECAALCAVAVKRKLLSLTLLSTQLFISSPFRSRTYETGFHTAIARFVSEDWRTDQFGSTSYRIPIAGDQMV